MASEGDMGLSRCLECGVVKVFCRHPYEDAYP